jgi:hypothetical protein
MVLVTKVLNSDDNLDLPRNTFDECVKQISPIAIRQRALPITMQPGVRVTVAVLQNIAAQALKARLLLYAASPQYNTTSGDLAKWQAAADASKGIIDGGKIGLYTTRYQNQYFPLEYIGPRSIIPKCYLLPKH